MPDAAIQFEGSRNSRKRKIDRASDDLETGHRSSKKRKPDVLYGNIISSLALTPAVGRALAQSAPGPTAWASAAAPMAFRPRTHSATPGLSGNRTQLTSYSNCGTNREREHQIAPQIKQEWDDGVLQMFIESTTPFRNRSKLFKANPLPGCEGPAAPRLLHGRHVDDQKQHTSNSGTSPVSEPTSDISGPPAGLLIQLGAEGEEPVQCNNVGRTLFNASSSASRNATVHPGRQAAQRSSSGGAAVSRVQRPNSAQVPEKPSHAPMGMFWICKYCKSRFRESENGPGRCPVPHHTNRLSTIRNSESAKLMTAGNVYERRELNIPARWTCCRRPIIRSAGSLAFSRTGNAGNARAPHARQAVRWLLNGPGRRLQEGKRRIHATALLTGGRVCKTDV